MAVIEVAGHVPVLVEELIRWLDPKPHRIYCDMTVGAGGHAKAVLEKAGPTARLIALDQDQTALKLAQATLKDFSQQIIWVEGNFGEVHQVLTDHHIEAVDGIYADLGLSSMQLSVGERGFSFQSEGPIDMRMNVSATTNALDLLRDLSEEALADVLYNYGEERLSRRIARRIKEALTLGELNTTTELAELVRGCFPPNKRFGRTHPATRTFQALRIYVNQELEQLDNFLEQAPNCLKPQGVLAVMSYHSLEDRPVKQKFRALSQEGFELLSKKPITPTDAEIEKNPRSRSAKLRGIRKQ